MAQFEKLFAKYDRLVLLDTETTGLQFARDEIIEFAAVAVERQNGEAVVVAEYDELVALNPGGISTQDLRERGLPKTRVCRDIAELIQGNTLLLAYNAHFDLSFLFYLLLRSGDPQILKGKDKLDLLTVYRDRHSYPHRLCNAIDTYRAVDDVLATVAVMKAMEAEKDDLERYVNLFGYNPKYGVEGKPIGSVTYQPQPYNPTKPLYEK